MRKIIILLTLVNTINLVFGQHQNQIEFKHQVLNFQISYPKNWILNTADDYYANLDRIKLQDSEFDEMIKKNASTPFFFIAKFEEPYDDINPSIKINTRPYGNLKGQSLKDIIDLMLPQFEKMLEDFNVEIQPTEIQLNDITATYVKFYYTLRTQDDVGYLTCSELYLIDRVNYFYMIGVGTRQDENNCKREEVLDILKTIKLN